MRSRVSVLKPAEKTLEPMTLLFVDVDGVLNVGIGDRGKAPWTFNRSAIQRAKEMTEAERRESTWAQMIMAVASRQVDNENTTYGGLCEGSTACLRGDLADIYIKRLADIIAAARTQGKLICVMSSTWRNRNVPGVHVLEEAVSEHLGETWTFDAKTASKESKANSGRLKGIGNFLTDWVAQSAENLDNVRVLVLEDFHISPLDGWSCGGDRMNSTQDVEAWLRTCLPRDMNAATCVIHTFEEWTTRTGVLVQVGSGLTLNHFCHAMIFLTENILAEERLGIPCAKAMPEPFGGYLDASRSKHINTSQGHTPKKALSCTGSGGYVFSV
jgi:hypothetical protein